jgi:Ca2+-binding RTX toxin-like protein
VSGIRASVETLERRALLSASVATSTQDGDVLHVRGTDADDVVSVVSEDGQTRVKTALPNGVSFEITYSGVRRIAARLGDGNDALTVSGKEFVPVTAYGGAGDDTITGTAGDDRLFGQAGDDSLVGGTGDDKLRGSDGSDVIVRGSATSTGGSSFALYGPNTIRVTGTDGDDIIRVTPEGRVLINDQTPPSASVRVFRTPLTITVDARGGNDVVTIEAPARAIVYGGAGNDLVTGGALADTLVGDAGDDTLIGLGGDDVLRGDDGVDQVVD